MLYYFYLGKKMKISKSDSSLRRRTHSNRTEHNHSDQRYFRNENHVVKLSEIDLPVHTGNLLEPDDEKETPRMGTEENQSQSKLVSGLQTMKVKHTGDIKDKISKHLSPSPNINSDFSFGFTTDHRLPVRNHKVINHTDMNNKLNSLNKNISNAAGMTASRNNKHKYIIDEREKYSTSMRVLPIKPYMIRHEENKTAQDLLHQNDNFR